MSDYIVCYRKRNNPRMDVRICEKKCALKEKCKELSAHRDQQIDRLPALEPDLDERQAA